MTVALIVVVVWLALALLALFLWAEFHPTEGGGYDASSDGPLPDRPPKGHP